MRNIFAGPTLTPTLAASIAYDKPAAAETQLLELASGLSSALMLTLTASQGGAAALNALDQIVDKTIGDDRRIDADAASYKRSTGPIKKARA